MELNGITPAQRRVERNGMGYGRPGANHFPPFQVIPLFFRHKNYWKLEIKKLLGLGRLLASGNRGRGWRLPWSAMLVGGAWWAQRGLGGVSVASGSHVARAMAGVPMRKMQ